MPLFLMLSIVDSRKSGKADNGDNMKKILMASLIVVTSLLNQKAATAAPSLSYETRVGAEAILRQVIGLKLLGDSQNALFGPYLIKALEGSGGSDEFVTIQGMRCDRELGSDHCVVSLESDNSQGQKINAFDLGLQIFQGKVISALVQ